MKRFITLILLSSITLSTLFAQSITSSDTLKTFTLRGTYYADYFVGRHTANGEIFRQDKYTAAHRTLQFGTLLLVTNPANNKQLIVKVNDRCMGYGILDLAKKPAQSIGVSSTKIIVQVLPQSYYYYWEHQDEYAEVLRNGKFLETVQGRPIPSENDSTAVLAENIPQKNTKKEKTSNPKPKPTPNPPPPQPASIPEDSHKVQLYNLELCAINKTPYESNSVMQKIPIRFRNLVHMREDGKKVRIWLQLSMKLNEIKEIQADLYELFPMSRAVEIEKN